MPPYSPFRRSPLGMLAGRCTLDHSPLFLAMDMVARVVSPYDLNPTSFNPLRKILAESIDFGAVRASRIRLFVTATHVRTGDRLPYR